MIKREFKSGVIYHGDCGEIIPKVGRFDHILTDPPYGYLNHHIETYFDYEDVFTKLRAGINNKGGILIFGRGDLFCEWNLYLRGLGFEHKEDCLYNKTSSSSMVSNMLRYGEYFTIRGLKGFKINKVKISIEDLPSEDDKRIAGWLRECKGDRSGEVIKYLQTGEITFDKICKARENVTVEKHIKNSNRKVLSAQSLIKGVVLGNVVKAPRELLKEGSHPTTKNHETLRLLVKAISSEGDTIIDPFLGSGSTALACVKENRKFIGIEKDREYFELACERIEKYESENLFV